MSLIECPLMDMLFKYYSKVFTEYHDSLNPSEPHTLLMNTCMISSVMYSSISYTLASSKRFSSEGRKIQRSMGCSLENQVCKAKAQDSFSLFSSVIPYIVQVECDYFSFYSIRLCQWCVNTKIEKKTEAQAGIMVPSLLRGTPDWDRTKTHYSMSK